MEGNKPLRVVIDTNLWISFLISDRWDRLDKMLNHQLKFLFSNELLAELIATIERPKFRKYFAKTSLEELLNALSQFIEWVQVESKVDLCRDVGDNFTKDGKANYIVTGDKDLIALNPFEGTVILTMWDFLNILETQ